MRVVGVRHLRMYVGVSYLYVYCTRSSHRVLGISAHITLALVTSGTDKSTSALQPSQPFATVWDVPP